MLQFILSLDNRELAWAVWAVTIVTSLVVWKPTRNSIKPTITILLSRPILILISVNLVYLLTIINLLDQASFWEIGLLKEAIIWLLFIGLTFTFSINKISKDPSALINISKTYLKLFFIFEYLINFYVLPFILEFILVPIFLMIGLMQGYIDNYEKNSIRFETVNKFLKRVSNLILFSMLIYVVYNFIFNISSLLIIFNLKELLFPVILTIGFMPVLYLIALYTEYEQLFLRIKLFGRNLNPNVIRFAKYKSLLLGNLCIHKVSKTKLLMSYDKLQDELSCLDFFNQELPSKIRMNSSTGIFRYNDDGFSEIVNYTDDGSVNSVIEYLGYNRDEIYIKYFTENTVFSVIGFKVFTFKPVFAITPNSTKHLSLDYVNKYIGNLYWNEEFNPLVIDDILSSAVKNKSFNNTLLWDLDVEDYVQNGKTYSRKLDLILVFEQGKLVNFFDKRGYNVWVKYIYSLNPNVIESYIKEAEFYNLGQDPLRITKELNRQAESFSKTPDAFLNENIDEFKTEHGNINFYNLLLCKYKEQTTLNEFKFINKGRYSILSSSSEITMLECGNNVYIFDYKGYFMQAIKLESALTK